MSDLDLSSPQQVEDILGKQGRPETFYSLYPNLKDNQYVFLAAYIATANDSKAAKAAGISRATIMYWKRRDDFAEAYEAARSMFTSALFARVFEVAMEGEPATLRWLLERLDPERFSAVAMQRLASANDHTRHAMVNFWAPDGSIMLSDDDQPPHLHANRDDTA